MGRALIVIWVLLMVATPIIGGGLVHYLDRRRNEANGLPIRHGKERR